jgi:Uma2 family endonuclease
MTIALRRPYTRADFLAWEIEQDDRWEFVDGVIKMMAGGSTDHNTIAGNLHAALHIALRGTNCRPFQQNMKLAPDVNDDVMYPDVVVICRTFGHQDPTLAAATFVAEVVSKSSQHDDYQRKWESYRMMPDLRHYMVIEQDRVSVSLFTRVSESARWEFQGFTGLDEVIRLDALGISLKAAEIYAETAVDPSAK